MSEASVTILVGASDFRCERRVALASASMIATNTVTVPLHCLRTVLGSNKEVIKKIDKRR